VNPTIPKITMIMLITMASTGLLRDMEGKLMI
jgi:hypothetical protein